MQGPTRPRCGESQTSGVAARLRLYSDAGAEGDRNTVIATRGRTTRLSRRVVLAISGVTAHSGAGPGTYGGRGLESCVVRCGYKSQVKSQVRRIIAFFGTHWNVEKIMIASVRMRLLTTKAAAAAAADPMRLTRGLKNRATAAELLPDVKRKIVVLSGKGGVGKSTLAARESLSLSHMTNPLLHMRP